MGGLLGLFLNPWALAAAGLLASSPVMIHLINRMRYRRVRWAAMEFLLAAQKRMKRTMVLEQMLLLASRVLLVLLFGFLLSRWLISGTPPAPPEDWVLHEVVLDDSVSMSDTSRDGGAGADCFALAFSTAPAGLTW
ncbi:MAG: BatA domain-containing protein [Gemmataceae bacterium]